MRRCHCGAEIQPGRLDALPNTQVCVNCTDEEKYLGVLCFGHKTAPSVGILNPKAKEAVRLVTRQYNRSR